MNALNPSDNLAKGLMAHFDAMMEVLPPLPPGVEWLMPLRDLPGTRDVFKAFLDKFYQDNVPRRLILGINPGRFGAGITNVSFTDPAHLERECGIVNDFPKKEELSAQFVYKVINTYGGPWQFYQQFFINSVVPFGFVKDGVNYNYYDDKILEAAVRPYAVAHLQGLLGLGMNREVCYCLGEGKNYRYLFQLNEREGLFGKIVPLSHPRFIMQYRRKMVDEFVAKYLDALNED